MQALIFAASALFMAADNKAEPLIMRLDPERRSMVVMALLGVVLIGGALVGFAWLGARRVRRMLAEPVRPSPRHEDAWYQKPLVVDEHEPRDGPQSP